MRNARRLRGRWQPERRNARPHAGPPSSPSPPPATGTDVLTYKYDLSRSGLNPTESTLTLANVAPATFGLLRVLSVDGKVDAQPLYVTNLAVAGAPHNAVIVATEHDSVYAFDSDTGASLWKVSLLGSGEVSSDTRGCGQITPEIGITSTPVIDRGAGAHGTVFVVAMSKDSSSAYHQRLHALDLATGAELLQGPVEVSATFPTAGGGTTTFTPGQYAERAALLLTNGTIVTKLADAYRGSQCRAERRSRTRHLDERRRPGCRFSREYFSSHRERRIRDGAGCQRIPAARGFRQLLP